MPEQLHQPTCFPSHRRSLSTSACRGGCSAGGVVHKARRRLAPRPRSGCQCSVAFSSCPIDGTGGTGVVTGPGNGAATGIFAGPEPWALDPPCSSPCANVAGSVCRVTMLTITSRSRAVARGHLDASRLGLAEHITRRHHPADLLSPPDALDPQLADLRAVPVVCNCKCLRPRT